jgi:hypothetical protein
MNTDRRAILSLIAAGRITAAEAERVLAAWNESRETLWILVFCLAFACIAQTHMHVPLLDIWRVLVTRAPALADTVQHAILPITQVFKGVL